MAIKTILLKRGLNADRGNITPQVGEPIYTTDTKKIFIGDGATAGGLALSYIDAELKGAANGVAELDANGKIPSAQLPALAVTDVFTAASEQDQLNLAAQEIGRAHV